MRRRRAAGPSPGRGTGAASSLAGLQLSLMYAESHSAQGE